MSAAVRVAFCLPGLHRVARGAEVAFESIAAALARRADYEVTLFGSGEARAGDPYRFVHADCVPRERFERWPKGPILRTDGHWEELTFLPGFLRRFRPSDFNVVVTCSYPLQTWAVRARRGRRRRPLHVFVTENGDWPLYRKNSEYLLFDCDALVCINPDYYDAHAGSFRTALIPNGVDTTTFYPAAGDRARFGLGPEDRVVLMASALIPSKRVMEGISAVAKLTSASLVVAGDGPLRGEVERAGNELMGARFRRLRVPREDMPALYRSADAFLHMSLDEPFGNVYVEALASGLPIVTHDRRVTRWTLGAHGTFVDAQNPESVAAAVERVLAEPGSKEARAAEARNRFDWKRIAEKYADFLTKCSARKPRGLHKCVHRRELPAPTTPFPDDAPCPTPPNHQTSGRVAEAAEPFDRARRKASLGRLTRSRSTGMTGPHETLPEPEGEPSEAIQAGTADLVARANLVVVGGKLTGRVFPLLRPETRVGRTAAAHIQLEERAISTRHATIVQTPDGHSVIDHGSTNGTFLNGRRLAPNEPFELSPGDSLQFAETVLTYLPTNADGSQEQTHYLSKLLPQVAQSSALQLPDTGLPDAQLLVQLLKATQPEEAPKESVSLEQRIAQLRQLVNMIRRNWLPLFLCAALMALAADASVFLKPPQSVAKCRIRITPPAGEKYDPYDRDNDSFTVPLIQSFTSPTLIEATLKAMGVPHPNKYKVDDTLTFLTFKPTQYATYEGTYTNTDPRYAVEFLTKHVEGFLKTEISHALHVAKTEVEFLESRVKEREAELRKTEAELEKFKQANMVGLPEFAIQHVNSREALYKQRSDLGAQMARANLELGAARKRMSEQSPLLTKRAEGAAPYETALVNTRRKLGEARAKGFGDQHPEVIALMKQEKELQDLADKARNTQFSSLDKSANPGLIDERHRVADLEVAQRAIGAQLGEVNEQLKRLDGIVDKLPEVEARFAELTRAYNVNTDLHAQLFSQLRQKQLALDLERSSVMARYEVLVPPETSGVQLRRVLLLRTLIGIAGGLVLGAFVVAILELRRYLATRRSTSQAIVLSTVRPD